jgi:hypothetical protein
MDTSNGTPVTASKYALVNRVATALNLGDFGKMEGFVERTAKYLERENETAVRNISSLKHNFKTDSSQISDDREDAVGEVDDAYDMLDPSKLKNNDMQKDFRKIYLAGIKKAEGKLLGIDQAIIEDQEAHDKAVKVYQDQIDSRKNTIKRLTQSKVKK